MTLRLTHAHREQQAKLQLRSLLSAEARRWRLRRAQLSASEPSVAARFELSIVDDELAQIRQSLAWLETATTPRRIR